MKQRDGAIELRRDCRTTRRREVHRAQLFGRPGLEMCVPLRIRGERGKSEKNCCRGDRYACHLRSLVPHCAARERARQALFARFSGALGHNPRTDVSHLNSCSSDLKH